MSNPEPPAPFVIQGSVVSLLAALGFLVAGLGLLGGAAIMIVMGGHEDLLGALPMGLCGVLALFASLVETPMRIDVTPTCVTVNTLLLIRITARDARAFDAAVQLADDARVSRKALVRPVT